MSGRGPGSRSFADYVRLVARRSGTNFYYSFVFLPRERREAMYATYAFCRFADDIADEDGLPADKARRLAAWREELARCYGGGATHPITVKLAEAVVRFGIPRQHFEAIIDGVEMDLSPRRYETLEELLVYCDRVASAVGLVCIEIYGYRNPSARTYAVHLGRAVQLTNILRDVRADAERGRVYLPQADLARFGVAEEALAAGRLTPALRDLLAFEAERAYGYYRSARRYLAPEDRRSLYPAETIGTIYERLLDDIVRHGYDVFSRPARVSGPRKLAIAAGHWAAATLGLYR
ncbi:MAG TPA: presqualene diphosphate synthase HpnD [Thermodesulfobacteriota bacterium]|nr:presqualene diphosphate synthase HpnD [Thermodesulfobacteriota bacterium]